MDRLRQGKTDGEFTGRHMLIVMLAFFGVIISVNITMAVLAQRSWTGLVVKNSYVASQHFNADLAEARRQSERGWTSALSYTKGEIQLRLLDSDGRPVIIDDLTLAYGRPAYEQADRTASLLYTGEGVYTAAVALLPGIWALQIVGGNGDSRYRRDSRLFVAKDGISGQED